MRKTETVQENKILKLLMDFDINLYYPIPIRKADQVVKNMKKGTCQPKQPAFLEDPRVEINERETLEKYLDLARELKKNGNVM